MKVSILINNFNNGPWLRECVDSALQQAQPADEIIVYDDGSTDDSLSILRAYGDRLTLIPGKHNASRTGIINQHDAIHTAFLAATGDHIHLLDGDDAYLPGRIESYERVWLTQPTAGMIQGPRQIIDRNGRQLKSDPHVLIPPEKQLAWIYRHNRAGTFYPTSSLAFSRDFLHRYLPLDFSDGLPLGTDFRLATLALLTSRILISSAPQTIYRILLSSISSSQRRMPQAALTRLHCQGFNLIATQCEKPPISYWRDRRYYRQSLREIAPKYIGDLFARFIVR